MCGRGAAERERERELFLAKYYHTNSQTLMVRYDEKRSGTREWHTENTEGTEKMFFCAHELQFYLVGQATNSVPDTHKMPGNIRRHTILLCMFTGPPNFEETERERIYNLAEKPTVNLQGSVSTFEGVYGVFKHKKFLLRILLESCTQKSFEPNF